MTTATAPVPLATAGTLAARAGFKLKQIRERLGLTLRQVEEASIEIADTERNAEHVVSVARLNQIENDGSLPSVYKLCSLAVIYGLGLEELLGFYGVNLSALGDGRAKLCAARTRLLSADLDDPSRPVHFPVRFDAGFEPGRTVFLSRMVELWGEVPAGLLTALDFKKHRYGYVGLQDRMMVPLLRPGSIVQIDESRRRVANDGWSNMFERPIYFVELRYSYECCWCYQCGRELTLIPSPLSPCGPRAVRVPDEGEVLGQVVGVAMRLVE